MNYNLVIHEIRNIEALTILAQQLKKTHGIPLQQALKQLEHLPVLFATNLDESSAQHYIEQYHQFGVTLRVEPASQDTTSVSSIVNLPTVPKHIRTSTQEHTTQTPIRFGKHETVSGKLPSHKSHTKSRRRKAALVLISLAISSCIVYIFISNEKLYIKPFSTTDALSGNAFTEEKQVTSANRNIRSHNNPAAARSVPVEKQQQSSKMADSAKMFPDDINMVINFYKIAISFNKYNFKAWSGLCAAYKSAGMKKEYEQCTKDIEELFGKQALSVSGIVHRYGAVQDLYTSEKSVLTITYASNANAQDQLTRETWSIIHLLLQNGTDSSITLISTKDNKCNSIVHVRPGMKLGTYEDFTKNASINTFTK